jgi:hypothetical protein
MATLTGFETAFNISQIRAIPTELAAISALTASAENQHFARIAQNYALRLSEFVRKRVLAARHGTLTVIQSPATKSNRSSLASATSAPAKASQQQAPASNGQ